MPSTGGNHLAHWFKMTSDGSDHALCLPVTHKHSLLLTFSEKPVLSQKKCNTVCMAEELEEFFFTSSMLCRVKVDGTVDK